MLIGYATSRYNYLKKKHSFYINFKNKITVILGENDFVKTEGRK